MKHTYDCNEFHLAPLGHWNWKWNSARSNYSVYERELLTGVLLLSLQTKLLADSPVVWLCDQASTFTRVYLQRIPDYGDCAFFYLNYGWISTTYKT